MNCHPRSREQNAKRRDDADGGRVLDIRYFGTHKTGTRLGQSATFTFPDCRSRPGPSPAPPPRCQFYLWIAAWPALLSKSKLIVSDLGRGTELDDRVKPANVASDLSYDDQAPADGSTAYDGQANVMEAMAPLCYICVMKRDEAISRKVEAMDISPIKNQRDYRKVLKEIEGLMMAKRNTPEGDRLDVLVTLVEAWERKHYPMDLPDPVEAIKYHMDQNGLQPRDLIPFIGSRNRVHEVLNRRRSLTLKMIWRLHEGLGIPAETLIKAGHDQTA